MIREIVVFIAILSAGLPSAAKAALEPPEHPLFDGDAVHEIHLTFHQADWWDQLTYNYENYEDIPYIEAEFDWETVHLDDIGVRFKGNSSYMSYSGYKNSFKLDIDEFTAGQTVYGLDKLNLNNCFLDPSFVREKCAYELCQAVGLPTERTNYAAVYINGTYWGLYILIEQFDQEFIESRFGSSEEGNLWKGEPHGSLEYMGSLESSYYDDYELKTNEELNDWSSLVELTDQLNNTALADLPDSMHNLIDVNSAMAMLVIDNLIVNLDSYIGRCVNYYFYHRDLDSRVVFAKWDQNEAWGIFNQYNLSLTQLKQLSPYWTSTQVGEDRPLAERLWQVADYDNCYLGHMKRLMAGAAHPDTLLARMTQLQDLVRPYVYDDVNNMFSIADFEISLVSDIFFSSGPPPGRLIPGLEGFIRARDSYLKGVIGTWTPIEGLVLNEIMAANGVTATDEYGDYDDWIEVANVGISPINMYGFVLTDHWEGSADFVFPDTTLQPGEYIVVWADDEPGEGDLHASFKLDGDGEDVYLTDGQVIIDQVTFPAISSDISWGRWPNGTGEWQMLSVATPGAVNQNPSGSEDVTLYINEFMASNSAGIQDETGAYADWVEIYNPGPEAVEMGGLFLTDDLTDSTKWMFPDTTLLAGGFMIVWCDSDPEDGPLHTSFKLSADGEDIAIYGRLTGGNELIDGYTYVSQTTDVSEGRETDGNASWVFFTTPTPGASNGSTGEEVVLYINEFLASNLSGIQDETSAYEDWVEIYNPGPDSVEMGGLFLTDDLTNHTVWTFPDTTLAAGGFMIVWCDEDEADGPLHASFSLNPDAGGELGIYGRLASGNALIDGYTFGVQIDDVSEGRETDGASQWVSFSYPTPGASNSGAAEDVTVYINEFLASNSTGIQDETSTCEDWVEIYNPGPGAVDMGGLFLTNDLTDSTMWEFPDTTLAAGDFMLVWCDDDEGDGPLHANLELIADGEYVAIYGSLATGNKLVDSYTFGAQTTDVSEGRQYDGGLPWVFFTSPTPGASNVVASECCGLYTAGYTGNCNCDTEGKRNLADISKLIDRVYISKIALCCEANGNVTGDIEAKVNLADISRLIDHVYISKGETAACP